MGRPTRVGSQVDSKVTMPADRAGMGLAVVLAVVPRPRGVRPKDRSVCCGLAGVLARCCPCSCSRCCSSCCSCCYMPSRHVDLVLDLPAVVEKHGDGRFPAAGHKVWRRSIRIRGTRRASAIGKWRLAQAANHPSICMHFPLSDTSSRAPQAPRA